MRKVLLAFFLSLLVSLPLLASAPKAPRRPLAPAPSPIAHIWAQVRSFLREISSRPTSTIFRRPLRPSLRGARSSFASKS